MPKLGVEIFRCDEPNIQVPKYLQVGRRVSLVLALRSQNRDFDAGAVQLAGDDEAVATVVAAAADEESLPWGVPLQGDTGHGNAGTFHQHAAWDAEILRRCVCAGHLLCAVELHPEIRSRRTTQTATAESSEWVMEM